MKNYFILSGDGGNNYNMVYAEGGYYHIHWNARLDWDHLMMTPSHHAEENDKTIIFSLNHTEHRNV